MARVPGGFGINDVMGVRRPDRSVSMNDAYADAVNTLLAWTTPLPGRGAGGGIPEPSPDWMSDITNSTVGQILGQPSLGDVQTAFSGWAAEGLSLPTPGGAMQQQKLAGGIDEALDWIRPLALADVGVAGTPGAMMFPFPAHAPGAAPVARGVGRVGGGIRGALRRLFGGGADEAVSAVAPVAASAPRALRRPAGPGLPPLFHGTSDSFDTFTARNRPLLPGLGVQGTHVTPVEQIAAHYGGEAGGRVISVEWALDRPPRILDTAGPLPDDLVDAASELLTPRQAAELRTHGTLAEVLTLGDVRPGQVGSPDEGAVAKAVRAKLSELYDVTLERVMPLAGGDGSPEYIFLNPAHIRIGSTRSLGG